MPTAIAAFVASVLRANDRLDFSAGISVEKSRQSSGLAGAVRRARDDLDAGDGSGVLNGLSSLSSTESSYERRKSVGSGVRQVFCDADTAAPSDRLDLGDGECTVPEACMDVFVAMPPISLTEPAYE